MQRFEKLVEEGWLLWWRGRWPESSSWRNKILKSGGNLKHWLMSGVQLDGVAPYEEQEQTGVFLQTLEKVLFQLQPN